MKKNPFKRRKKDQKPKEEDKQLVSTEREAAATNESQGGQLQVQVPSHGQHFPPPHVIVNPGPATGNGQNMTIINRFYYKICGFPERKESDKPAVSCMIRSMWTLLLLLIIVVVLAVAVVIIAVAILIFSKDEPEQEKMNKWEKLFQILGGGLGTVLETAWNRLFG